MAKLKLAFLSWTNKCAVKFVDLIIAIVLCVSITVPLRRNTRQSANHLLAKCEQVWTRMNIVMFVICLLIISFPMDGWTGFMACELRAGQGKNGLIRDLTKIYYKLKNQLTNRTDRSLTDWSLIKHIVPLRFVYHWVREHS